MAGWLSPALDSVDAQARTFPRQAQRLYLRSRRWILTVGKRPLLSIIVLTFMGFFATGFVASGFDSCESNDCFPFFFALLALFDLPIVVALAAALGVIGHRFRAWRAKRRARKQPSHRITAFQEWAKTGLVDDADVIALKERFAVEDDLLQRVRRVNAFGRGMRFWVGLVCIIAAIVMTASAADGEFAVGVSLGVFWLGPLLWVLYRLSAGMSDLTAIEWRLEAERDHRTEAFEDDVLRRARTRFASASAPVPPPSAVTGRPTYRRS